jgi:hypothetical protein
LIKYKSGQPIEQVTLIHRTRNKGFPMKYFNTITNIIC